MKKKKNFGSKQVAYLFVIIDQIKEWHVADDEIEKYLRMELNHHCSTAVHGEKYFPPTDDGRGAMLRVFVTVLIPENCIEKAIVAAGGPEIYCSSQRKPPQWKNPASPWIPFRDGPIGTVVNNAASARKPAVTAS